MNRYLAGLILLLSLDLLPAAACAGLVSVSVDHVAVESNGTHRVWVSILDAEGVPVKGLRSQQITIEEDTNEIPGFDLKPYESRYKRMTVSLVVDPRLVAGSDIGLVPLLARLRRELRTNDRLRVVSSTDGFPTADVPAGAEGGAIQGLVTRITGVRSVRTTDAVLEVLRRARSEKGGQIVLLVTGRGPDQSRAQGVDLLALLRGRERLATVCLIEFGNALPVSLRSRYLSLVGRSGGIDRSATTAAEAAEVASMIVSRCRGSYLATYRFSGWRREVDDHAVKVTVRQDGKQYVRELRFHAADVVEIHTALPVWLGLGGFLLLAVVVAFWILPARPICRLGVEGGPEQGFVYEIQKVPVLIGATEGNDLILNEPLVSRNHAILSRRGGHFELEDQNSEHGTFVNGVRILRHSLARGDQIDIGTVRFRFLGPR